MTLSRFNTGMVFGVFDGLHEGHKHFLRSAAKECDELIVTLALDAVVEALKGKKPVRSLEERIRSVQDFNQEFLVISGDSEVGSWAILKEKKPDIVFLGYDQHDIRMELERMQVSYRILTSHEPKKFKSSLIL